MPEVADCWVETEAERVLGWRLYQLLEAGYTDLHASALAARSDVDLHQAVALVERGCPPATAAEILL